MAVPVNQKSAENLSFGEWLRQRRHILDLTQQELADQVGCARITLRRIEAGALKPSKELASILLEKLGMLPAEREEWLRFARGLIPLPEKSAQTFISPPTTNLPIALTSFIGREKERQEIANLLDRYRLVTLIGPGGIGKTRLSLEVGQKMLPNHPDGVWLVELAPILDPLLVLRTTAIAIGLRDEPQRPVLDMLSDYLRGKQMLIILDNCEHVLDPCIQLVDTLLKNCAGLKILATSREPLGIIGEAIFRVPSLGLPDIKQLSEKTRYYESIRLFEERAQLVQIGFLVTTENASYVARICRQLDGIPLAIELAAARVKMLSAEQIAARLEQSFNLLTSGNRTSLPRHQTLQAAIDWSYDLLSPAEQTLFRRLSVFVNGWTLEAVEAVCSDLDLKPEYVLDLLSQLINKSLVTTEELRAETRYRMLETIRSYANEKLGKSGEGNWLKDQHLAYFLNLAETAAPHLIRPEQLEWLARLDVDYENLRAALEWSLNKEPAEPSLRLCAALGRFWLIRCYWMEGSKWLESALSKPERSSSNSERVTRLKARYKDIELADNLDDLGRLKASAELSLRIAQENLDKQDIAIARLYWGKYLRRKGRDAEAQRFIEQSLTEFQELKDSYWEANAYDEIVVGLQRLAAYRGTSDLFESLLHNVKLARKSGDRLTIAGALSEYIYNLYVWERTEEAIGQAIEVEALFKEIGSNPGSTTTMLLAEIAWLDRNYQKARSLYAETEARLGVIGEKNLRSGVIASLGLLSMEEGKLSEAQSQIEEALAIATEIGNKMFITYRLAELAQLFYLQGNLKRCKQKFQQSFLLAKELAKPQKKVPLVTFLSTLYALKPKNTAKILGSIDNFAKEYNDPITPLRKRYYNLADKYSREVLGDSAFHSAFIVGRALSLDDALDLALKTLEEK